MGAGLTFAAARLGQLLRTKPEQPRHFPPAIPAHAPIIVREVPFLDRGGGLGKPRPHFPEMLEPLRAFRPTLGLAEKVENLLRVLAGLVLARLALAGLQLFDAGAERTLPGPEPLAILVRQMVLAEEVGDLAVLRPEGGIVSLPGEREGVVEEVGRLASCSSSSSSLTMCSASRSPLPCACGLRLKPTKPIRRHAAPNPPVFV